VPAFLVQVQSFSSTQWPRAPLSGAFLGVASDLHPRPSRARISAGFGRSACESREPDLFAARGHIRSAAPMTRIVTTTYRYKRPPLS